MKVAVAAVFLGIILFVALGNGLRDEPPDTEATYLSDTKVEVDQPAADDSASKHEPHINTRQTTNHTSTDMVTSDMVLEKHGINVKSFYDVKDALLDPKSSLNVRENAAAFLAKSEFPGAGAALSSAIEIEDDAHSLAVVRVMFKIDREEVMGAVRNVALSDRSQELRSTAIARLAQNGDREVLQTLALSIEESEAIRSQAVFGHLMGWSDSDEAVLGSLTSDPSTEVRAAASIVLSNRSADIDIAELIDLANEDSLRLETLRNIATEVSRRISSGTHDPKSLSEIQRELRRKDRSELLSHLEAVHKETRPKAKTVPAVTP